MSTGGGFQFGGPPSFGSTGGGDAGGGGAPGTAAKGFTFGQAPQQQSQPTQPQTTAFSFAATTASDTAAKVKPVDSTSTTITTTLPSIATNPTTTAQFGAPLQVPFSQPTKTTAPEIKTVDHNQTANQFSFNKLEEHINKWKNELERQETCFINQATQINAWDKLLILNNDKIISLNEAAQKVKLEQDNLEQELEFIATQHTELEESLLPLQRDFQNTPQVDVERTQTYLLVENLDTQLKQMSEDLKEVIDLLNETTKAQDSNEPIVQIGKILNAHMNSLHWIEASTSAIGMRLEDISKMHDSLKESERLTRLPHYE